MLDNTRYAIDKLKKDLQFISWIFNYGVHLLLLGYYTFALLSNKGDFIINILLLCVTVSFVVISIINNKKELSKKRRKEIRNIKHFINWLKILAKTYTLVGALYAMYIATTTVNPIEIILTTFLILLWIIDLLVEMIKMFINFETDRIFNALKKDFEPMIKVKDAVTNTVEQVKDGIEDARSRITKFFHKENKKIK